MQTINYYLLKNYTLWVAYGVPSDVAANILLGINLSFGKHPISNKTNRF